MTERSVLDSLALLFEETARAHHEAFAATEGVDEDWALWYAARIQDPLAKLTGGKLSKAEIVVALVDAEAEHQARFPDELWPRFYAKYFCERYTCEPDETLALYYTPSCPFCVRVLRVIDELKIEVELRDIWINETYRSELREARGRTTVPVLRCTSASKDRWMPESADIVRYLRGRFATTSNSAE
jgi:glutaredoxin